MPVRALTLALAATPKRLSAAYPASSSLSAEQQDISFRQVVLSTAGADAYLGDATVTTATGVKITATAPVPLSLGPFTSGAVKLSDLYAVGAGATLQILGVPF